MTQVLGWVIKPDKQHKPPRGAIKLVGGYWFRPAKRLLWEPQPYGEFDGVTCPCGEALLSTDGFIFENKPGTQMIVQSGPDLAVVILCRDKSKYTALCMHPGCGPSNATPLLSKNRHIESKKRLGIIPSL